MGISPRPFELLIAISVLENDTIVPLFDTKNKFNVFSVSKIDTEKTQKRRKKTWNNALFVKQKYKTTSRYVPYATRVWHRLLQHSRYFIKSRLNGQTSVPSWDSARRSWDASTQVSCSSRWVIIGFQGNSTRKLAIAGIVISTLGLLIKITIVLQETQVLPPWLINGLHWYIYAYVSMLVEDTASTGFFYSHFKSVKRKVSKQERKVSKGLRASIKNASPSGRAII